MVYMDVHVSSHLKEELAWATDKRLRVISTTYICTYNVIPKTGLRSTMKLKGNSHFKFKTVLFALLCGPWYHIVIVSR